MKKLVRDLLVILVTILFCLVVCTGGEDTKTPTLGEASVLQTDLMQIDSEYKVNGKLVRFKGDLFTTNVNNLMIYRAIDREDLLLYCAYLYENKCPIVGVYEHNYYEVMYEDTSKVNSQDTLEEKESIVDNGYIAIYKTTDLTAYTEKLKELKTEGHEIIYIPQLDKDTELNIVYKLEPTLITSQTDIDSKVINTME